MVAAYLADTRVILKNKDKINFDNAIKVFVRCEQTVGQPLPSSNAQTLVAIKADFTDACGRYVQREQEQAAFALANKRYCLPLPFSYSLCLSSSHCIMSSMLIQIFLYFFS